jgi:ribose transport system substrate-binding protein
MWEGQMSKTLLALAVAAMTLSAGSAMAQKKQLVIVVKGLDNPFFEAIHQGCEKWNKENAGSPYHCFYTGPASTSDEAGEAQIVQDMLGKSDTTAIAISPSNAPLIANAIKAAKPKMPVMTLDADLKKEDAALRKTYLGTDNYLMGFRLGEGEAEWRNGLFDRGKCCGGQHSASRIRHSRCAVWQEGFGQSEGRRRLD